MMRTIEQIQQFQKISRSTYLGRCQKCKGSDPHCECYKRYLLACVQYESCIPRDFWDTKASEISHDKAVFRKVIQKYIDKSTSAMRFGYGLVLLGGMGTGKTHFASYVLTEAIKKGRTTYYTTMPQLGYDIKLGFDDRTARSRLMFYWSSDFVMIDDLGKESYRKADNKSFLRSEIERLVRQRRDEAMPMIMTSDMGRGAFLKNYHDLMTPSMLSRMKIVMLKSTNKLPTSTEAMEKQMGY